MVVRLLGELDGSGWIWMDLDGSGWNVVGMLLENVGDIDFQRDTLPTFAELFNTCWTDPSWA